MVVIEEVKHRAEQGVTRPFRCRGEDGKWYFVKSRASAGYQALLHEWVAGVLAKEFDLPIAPFSCVDVPSELIIPELGTELEELGAGVAFGSQQVDVVQELSISHLDDVPVSVQQDVLVFDWWVKNGDRTLTPHGGNPNLLWDQINKSLVVIDHNMAFDKSFEKQAFIDGHVFSGQIDSVFLDIVKRAEYEKKIAHAMKAFQRACDTAPDEWYWIDFDEPVKFDREEIATMLNRFRTGNFWNLT